MENLLYYPHIDLPRTDWTIRNLLYYEKIGSIVPEENFYSPECYHPFMREMIQNELVIPINPMEVLEHPREIIEKYIEYTESEYFDVEKRKLFFTRGASQRIHRGKLEYSGNKIYPNKFNLCGNRIHRNKFDMDIFDYLERMGLAIQENNSWFIVEKTTSIELMIFLATVIGEKIDYQLTTDRFYRNSIVPFKSKQEVEIYELKNQKRVQILNELIPFPQDLDIIRLRRFKDRHRNLLRSFKNKVELIVLDDSIDYDSELFKEKVNELQIAKEELTARMNESRFGPIFYGTICGMLGAALGLIPATSMGFYLGIPAFLNAIYSASKIEKPENIIDQTGLKYIALIDKRLRNPYGRNLNNY